ncbi:MAG TPA: cation diffusion facilitator family transporter [Candidatus Saccharimonadales bacterium]
MTAHHRSHEHTHSHEGHGHSHGLVDPSIVRSREGVKAVSLSFSVMLVTALIQLWLFTSSHSIALLADTIHNAGDALTAIPLGLAFFFQSKRGERWSGYFIVFLIFVSACITLYQVVNRIIHPHTPTHLLAILIAGIAGVLGNEVAAVIRWQAGKRLDSPALIADGNHARADGIVSAGVIISTVLIAAGFPVADPLIGLAISGLILRSSWQSWKTIRS